MCSGVLWHKLRSTDCDIAVADSADLDRELKCHYRVPHIRFVLRSRVLWQTGCCAGIVSASVVRWLLRNAPLWVVVRVCELLRKR